MTLFSISTRTAIAAPIKTIAPLPRPNNPSSSSSAPPLFYSLPPTALRAFLLNILLLFTTLIVFGALLNAVMTRRRDRLRREAWEEYWADEASPPRRPPPQQQQQEWYGTIGAAGSPMAAGTARRGARGVDGATLIFDGEHDEEEERLLGEGAVVSRAEDGEAPPRYDGLRRPVLHSGVVVVLDRTGEEPPDYEEATKEDGRRGNGAGTGERS